MVKLVAKPYVETWDPNKKELWHMDFEKEPVNDDRWTCIVTAAIQAQAQDEECIKMYSQKVATGLRKAVTILSMGDVIKLLKMNEGSIDKGKKKGKTDKKKEDNLKEDLKNEKKNERMSIQGKDGAKKKEKLVEEIKKELKPPLPKECQIVNLARQYAVYTENECQLPPDLMAGVLKYLILNIKTENYFWKKVQEAKNKKIKNAKIKAKFIANLENSKPNVENEREYKNKASHYSIPRVSEQIDDEPFGGPDLYIMLVDFYNPFYFSELQKINVPFVAIFEVSKPWDLEPLGKASYTSVKGKAELTVKKSELISNFWNTLKQNCMTLESTRTFKDILMMKFQSGEPKIGDFKENGETVFHELSWMQYAAYCVYRQHQNYIQGVKIQRLVTHLEPLDLSKCYLYNKLCEALITGEPNTAFLILYAMIEQVVVGVPYIQSIHSETLAKSVDFICGKSTPEKEDVEKKDSEETVNILAPPCMKCRNKNLLVCADVSSMDTSSSEENWFDTVFDKPRDEGNLDSTVESITFEETEQMSTIWEEYVSLLNQVLEEKKTEREIVKDKKWKTPMLCFYGDYVALQTYHCDRRIINPELVVERFFKNTVISLLWSKYPELPRPERAFYNYQFNSLWKVSKEKRESLKLKIYFTIAMKLIGLTKSYLYKGQEEIISEMLPGTTSEKLQKLSKVRFDRASIVSSKKTKSFSNFFFKTFMEDMCFQSRRKTVIQIDNIDRTKESGKLHNAESYRIGKAGSQFNILYFTHRSSGSCVPYCIKQPDSSCPIRANSLGSADKDCATLAYLLDCFEVGYLAEPHFISDTEEYSNIIEKYNFFERLEPGRMVQRLLEAHDTFNTTQYSYFGPTDTLMIVMQNDYDHRGIFFTKGCGILPTPVCLRDFYNYVYPEIGNWLIEEELEFTKFITEIKENIKEKNEIKEVKYLAKLKKEYCEMSEEERDKFLSGSENNNQDEQLKQEISVTEEDLEDLPIKSKPDSTHNISFVTTNFADIRVEAHRRVHEFHSKDGTEVNVTIDSWLYNPLSLLTLCVKHDKLRLYYYQSLGNDDISTTDFTLRTTSDIILTFEKVESQQISQVAVNAQNNLNHNITISWPTGLIIKGKRDKDSNLYIKQGYLFSYRKNSVIHAENFRCFLKNGQILIFKENGDVEILCGSGTKYYLYGRKKFTKNKPNQDTTPRCEVTTTYGEVWEEVNEQKKKLKNTFKVYSGTDPRTHESFYRRDDGVYCMLWPNGTLVTMYPDGTKITSIPKFEETETEVEWTEEEKRYYQLKVKQKLQEMEQEQPKTILRKLGTPTYPTEIFRNDNFISVSCWYLMEHPKYSSVHFKVEECAVEVKMVEHITVLMNYDGSYEVKQETNCLNVGGTTAEFYRECPNCKDKSIATINLDSDEILCKFEDFFQQVFMVYRKGDTLLNDNTEDFENENSEESVEEKQVKKGEAPCLHLKNSSEKERCFAFERDRSGIEFVNVDSLARYSYQLSENTYYDLHSECAEESTISHKFSSPYSKIGYEKWTMDYEDKFNTVPTNLKKSDLKEMGLKENPRKLFKYTFPAPKCRSSRDVSDAPKMVIEMPKVVITRIIRCLSQQPSTVINDLQKYVTKNQKKIQDLCSKYKIKKYINRNPQNQQMRLEKIASTFDLNPYWHMCEQFPSIDKNIHYFGHYINLMESLKDHVINEDDNFPDCKQIPRPLPRIKKFDPIEEEDEKFPPNK